MSTYNYDKLRATATRLITKFGNEIKVTNKSYVYDQFGNKASNTDETFTVQGVFTDTHNILIQSQESITVDDSAEPIEITGLFHNFGLGNFPQQFELKFDLTPNVDGSIINDADFILFGTQAIDGFLDDGDGFAVTDNEDNFVLVE